MACWRWFYETYGGWYFHQNSEKVIIPIKEEDTWFRLWIIAYEGGNSEHLEYQASAQKLRQSLH